MSKYTKTARGICDLLLFVALNASNFALYKLVRPFKRGFFCGDESLGYPLRENTIGAALLISLVLGIPTSVIVVVELFKQLPGQNNGAGGGCDKRKGCRLLHRFGQLYKQAGYYLFGFAMVTFATLLSKNCIGRLRPHFYAACQPMLADGTSCADVQNQGRYIDSYTCTNANVTDFIFQQLNQSFPSGHASMMMYAMLYLAIYLQAALSTRISKLLKHLLQFLFVMLAWYASLTRITDFWHHWSDVLSGVVLGAIFAFLTTIYVADLFAFKRWNRGSSGAYCTIKKSQVSPKNSAAKATTGAVAAAAAPPALPAYTFGTLPYVAHPAQAAHYAQTYHNYGYVP
ncbi:putative phosphatidate phosphatase [Scaptodrosophila lebanonensis]|uniref:Phosphatidate phosphatase n=1 Tax=Drosophila lebanonensis TaxID=7225 RepID=A0A6J2T4K3_DROLE|nr:putative phosphatidate phosphatase [Scaptodrosophila lebanonensis]